MVEEKRAFFSLLFLVSDKLLNNLLYSTAVKMGPIKQKKNKPSSRREVEDNPHKIAKGEPLPENVVLELIGK